MSFTLRMKEPLGELAGLDERRFALGRPDRRPVRPPCPLPGRCRFAAKKNPPAAGW
ncbi:MAG: hypothetical protein JF607_26135 [Burkholderiales bacterium]|nr:hypothetical protein [Burkholderiales bacterium]